MKVPESGLPNRRAAVAITAAAVLIFAAYAGSFLYFFVDDEAIPLVYARNLLRGRGLVYTVLEGRTEGYSDFLHVLWSAALLAATHAGGLSALAPLLIGKATSLAAGASILCVSGWFLHRQGASSAGLAAGLLFLALAGPLAVWACSSLETVPFALLVIGFTAALFAGMIPAAVVLGVAAALERIDGPIFIFAIVLAAAQANPDRRTQIWRAARWLAVPTVLFHAWRYWYFGALVPTPIGAKVLYHLTGSAHALVKSPDVSYLAGLARLYGTPAVVIATLLAAFAVGWRHRTAQALIVGIVVLALYVQLVGDWMFGWRLAVALLPLLSVILGLAISRLPRKSAWAAAAALIAWSTLGAYRFEAAFVAAEHKPAFWSRPRAGEAIWLAPYDDVVQSAGRVMRAGDRVAYNQAGLLPYLLDVENIDDLGICSRFIAELPTTDVYFTGVGRYSPLTDQPILHTAQAYLLYKDVRFLVARADLLWRANGDRLPDTLLDGYFVREATDASKQNVIYRRSPKPADEYRRDASSFTENVAHTTRLTYAALGGRRLTPAQFGPELPFLREAVGYRPFRGDVEIDLHISPGATVSGLYIGRVTTSRPGSLTIVLADESGRQTQHRTLAIAPGGVTLLERFDAAVPAIAASLHFALEPDDQMTLTDVRLEGQSRALRNYLYRRLRFPAL